MFQTFAYALNGSVALLAEGVDRNFFRQVDVESFCVALLAEGVDRNYQHFACSFVPGRRPPRGGRG